MDLRVGRRCPQLDRMLATRACRHWAFVTASNPGSRPLPAWRNAQRTRWLAAPLRRRYAVLPGLGIPEDRGWQPEVSLLVLGLAPGAALENSPTIRPERNRCRPAREARRVALVPNVETGSCNIETLGTGRRARAAARRPGVGVHRAYRRSPGAHLPRVYIPGEGRHAPRAAVHGRTARPCPGRAWRGRCRKRRRSSEGPCPYRSGAGIFLNSTGVRMTTRKLVALGAIVTLTTLAGATFAADQKPPQKSRARRPPNLPQPLPSPLNHLPACPKQGDAGPAAGQAARKEAHQTAELLVLANCGTRKRPADTIVPSATVRGAGFTNVSRSAKSVWQKAARPHDGGLAACPGARVYASNRRSRFARTIQPLWTTVVRSWVTSSSVSARGSNTPMSLSARARLSRASPAAGDILVRSLPVSARRVCSAAMSTRESATARRASRIIPCGPTDSSAREVK